MPFGPYALNPDNSRHEILSGNPAQKSILENPQRWHHLRGADVKKLGFSNHREQEPCHFDKPIYP
jgi:hypothetical protein